MVNCLNNSEIFDFFVARKFELYFFSESWKTYYFRQRSFPKGTRTEMTFSESFVLVLRDKVDFDLKLSNRVLRIAQAFVSNVELRSEEQTVFFDTALWKKRHFRKGLCFSALWNWGLIVFGYCLWARTDSYITCLVELEDAKSSFSMWICGRTTCTENNFSSRAIEACMFSNVVCIHGHEIFCRVLRSKTVFSRVNSGRNNLFRKKMFLIMLNERLIVFKFGILAHPDLYWEVWLV